MDWQIQQLAYNCGGFEWGTNEVLFNSKVSAMSFKSTLRKMGYETAFITMANGYSVVIRSLV